MNRSPFNFLIVIFLVISLASCQHQNKSNFITEFAVFIRNVQKKNVNFTENDWDKADKTFSEYKDVQYLKFQRDMTDNDKRIVDEMISNYRSLEVKRGVRLLKNNVNNIIYQSKNIVEELEKDSSFK